MTQDEAERNAAQGAADQTVVHHTAADQAVSDQAVTDRGSAGPGAALLDVLAADRMLCIVRAPRVPDPAGLAAALAGAGIRAVEFTFTIENVLPALEAAAAVPGAWVGAGTVLTTAQARDAIAAGARYLITPDVRPEIAAVGAAAGVPVLLGAFTPTEVAQAAAAGACAVKIFPARLGGPNHLRDLHGPFPDLRLVATGGVDAGNARSYLDAGALAVAAGSQVVPPDLVLAAAHEQIARRAAGFAAAVRPAG